MHLAGMLAVALLAAPAPPRVAVLDVQVAAGAPAVDRAAMTEVLAGALQDREAWRLLTMRDVEALLGFERQRQVLGCGDAACFAEIGGALGTDAVVVTTVAPAGAVLVVSGRVVDGRSPSVLVRSAVQAGPAGLLDALGEVGRALRAGWREHRRLPPLAPPVAALPPPPLPPEPPRDCEGPAECQQACRTGDGPACARLGLLLRGGSEADAGRAAAALERACQLGEAASCVLAGDAWVAQGLASTAAPNYRRACLSGLPDALDACARGGVALLGATGLDRDLATGAQLAQRACAEGRSEACAALGAAVARGERLALDDRAAAAHLDAACRARQPGACLVQAEWLLAGRGGPAAPARAGALFSAACDQGVPQACLDGGAALEAAGQPAAALPLYQGACLKPFDGAATGCARAVRLLLAGAAGPPDPQQVTAYARRACTGQASEACALSAVAGLEQPGADPRALREMVDAGCAVGPGTWAPLVAQACYTAAAALSAGRGLAADPTRAVAIFEAACRSGHAAACRSAATSYRVGRAVARDDGKARRLTEAACHAGSAQDCHALATAFEEGRGVEQDLAEAARLHDRACGAGDPAACLDLARAWHFGLGVAASKEKAAAARARACTLGARDACP